MLQGAILHQDEAVIVLNKPPGLAVQGGSRSERHLDGLLDGLRFGHAERPKLVHRLDKETSGVLVIARSAAAAAFLTRAFREKTTRKIYWALAVGCPETAQGRIAWRSPSAPARAANASAPTPTRASPPSPITASSTASASRVSWLALLPVTGRTHQLRAHCAAIGTPILGDGKYGGAAAHLAGPPGARRLHLHARALSIPHPQGGILKIAAPLPPHMRQSWEFFGFSDDVEDPFAGLDLPE